ncbi:DUF7507 domain-containing protein [Flavobacterium collinsii]|nr:choice-of-anchor L domain-containing protein [Flavobacterium collinsii]
MSASMYAQATITTNPSNLQINTALNGPGIVIVGGTLSGAATAATLRANQVATFSNGVSGAGLQIPSGAYFTTGNAPFELANRNTDIQKSFNPAGATTVSDPNLSTIDPTATRDLVSYSFTITLAPNVSGLLFSYQFGSEEYPDYVGSNFDDAFGFFVSGPGISGVQNFATLPNGSATSINKVNAGIPGFNSPATPVPAYDGSQSALYINNGHITTITGGKYNLNAAPQPGPFPIFTEHNGLTKSIKKSIIGLTPGGTYTFKVVIADAGDASLDSGVFLDIVEGIISADLSVSKTVSNPSPNVGSNVVFTLTAGNTGPGNAPNTKVTDLLPAGYTFVSATPSVGTYDSSTGVWDIGLLNIGSSPTLQITANVKAAGPYLNSASIASPDIADPTPGNNTSSVTPTPVAQSNVGITKTASSATPNVGSNVTFTLTATNAGPSNATGVSVTDILPSGYTFVSSSTASGTYTSGTGIWAIGTLANGANATLSIIATVNASGTYTNSASITANEADPTPGNNTSSVTPTPVAQSNVGITKTASSATPNVGSNVTFTLTATNAGPSNATGVSVTDILPSGYTFVSSSTASGTYTSGTGIWAIGTLANGANATLSIIATVNASGTYTNSASITANEADPTPGNNTSSVTPTPVAQSNVGITKTASSATPNVGSNVTFTLTATNAGPSNATGVSVTDILPSGYTFVSSSTASGTYTSGTGIWAIGTLANGANATLSIIATVNASGTYTNSASITANEADPTPGNNTSSVTPTPVAQSNVGITKTASSATPNVGSNVTFTLTATNAGPSNATGVSVTDILPSGYTFVSSSTASGTYTSGTGIWAIGTLANGANATLSIIATVNASGTYTNSASITANEADPTPGNNTSSVTPTPVAQSNVGITKTASSATPNVGSNVTFTLTATNVGPSNATGVSVTDILPSGYTFVSSSTASGTYTSGTGIWAIGTLANGANATLSIIATVNASGTYTNSASITANEADPTPGNNTSSVTPTPVAQSNVGITKTASSATPNVGSNVTFTLTATNAGPSNATGVSVTDILPSGYTFVSSSTASGTYTSGTGIWAIGTLANGANATLSIIATVNASGTYTNSASITANEADPTPGNNTSSVTPTPVAQSNVGITKTASSATPNVGSNVTFTLTATNAGPSNATGVSVTDILPSGYTFVSSSTASGTYTSGTGIWAIGTLANGANATLSIIATVNASGTYTNSASITANEADPTPGNNTSSVTPTPVAQSNVGITKTASSATPNVGSNVTFTLTATNAGPSNATGVSVTDILPSGYTFVSSSTASGTYTSGTGIWAIGTLANGANATLSIIATVNASGTYTNSASITANEADPTPGNNTSSVTPTPVAQSNVGITKTASSATPNVGSNVTFTLTATNAGPSNATGVSVTDILPSGYTFVSSSTASGTYTSGTGIWAIGTLANGANATLSIIATVNASGTYTNSASITANEADPTPGNNTSSVTPTPVAQSNVGITKTASSATPNVGSNVTFTLTATNVGPSNATGVSVTDILPSGYTFVSSSTASGTYTSGTGIWAIGTLANGANATLSIIATVNASGTYTNSASITANEADPTPGNNTSSVTPTPVAQSNVGITKTASSATPNVGSNVTFTLTATNAGPSNATGVSVTDILPSGYTFVSSSTASGTYTSGTGIWAIGTLANGANATLSIIATVNASGTYTNSASITANEADPTPGNNTSSVTPTPVAQSNVGITKTASSATPNVGSNVTFTLTATNAGPSNATGVSVTDILPSGYTFVSSSTASGTYTSGTGIWAIGTLANGANATLSIIATVNASGTYTNSASITANEADPTPGNNTSSVTPTPVAQSNVGITKTASSATPNVGSNVTFTLTATNAGPSNATGVSVTDILPSGYTFVSSSTASGTYTSGTGIWAIGTLANGANATLSIIATVNASGTYTNSASITANEADPTPGNNTSSVTPTPVAQSNVGITKTASSATPNVGSNVTFTLTATNAGPSNATGVSVTDILPSGYTFVSSSTASGTYTSGTGIWAIGTLANGANATLSIIATVNASGTYTNSASITANEADPTPGNNTSSVTPTPVAQSNVGITKTASSATPNVGSNVTFTLTATNAGPSNATGVSVTDILPSGYTFVSSSTASGTYTSGTGIWAIGTLANGANATLSIIATVNASGTYTNSASITANEADPTPGNNTSSVTPTPVAQSNVGITKTASSATPNVGSNVTFTLTATNAGPSNATGVSVTDILPSGYTFVSSSTASGTYTSGTGIWAIGTLANGANATLSIIATVNASGTYTNSASITANEADPTPGNNTSSVTPTPVAQSNVGITKTASSATPNVGSNVTFTLTATNAGPSNATGVSVTDILPSGYTFVSSSTASGTYTSGTGIWAIGTLANGANATLSIIATVNASGTYTNSASITANEADPTPGNNTSSVTPTPVAQSNVGITKTASSATPNVGSNVTFTLTATNAGPSNATGVSVTDILPSGYTFVSSSTASGTYTSGTGIWAIGTLANGANATLSIIATVNASGTYTNSASITANEADPTPGNNTSSVTPTPVAQSNVGITKTASSATPNVGSNVTFTLTATNAGPSNATGVSVTDILPSGYTFVSSSTASGTYTSGTGIWAIGTLANGANATLSIIATVNASGTYTNSASITANEADPTPGNNTSSVTPTPVAQSNVGITKTASSATPNVGSNVTFTLTATNVGPSNATGVSVTDILPSGYTFVSSSTASGTYTSGTGIWAIGTLANGANATLSIIATVNASGTYTNSASITANEADPTPGNNTSSVTPTPINIIAALTETTASINGNSGGITPALTANDTLNGNPVVIGTNAGEVTLTGVSVPSGLTLNADGTVTVAANTPAGNYTVTYTICEVTNTSNCSTVSSTVVVSAASIAALTETTASINGNAGGTTPALTANDTLNGNPVVIGTGAGEVTLTGVNVPSGLTLNVDGTVTVAANTPAGNYTVTYTICEVTNTSNCSTVKSIIIVGQSSLDAIEDDFTTYPINGTNGGTTQTVFGNDLYNGKSLNALDVDLQFIGVVLKGFSLNPNGTITIAPNTIGGNYLLKYQICDKLNSNNCSIAKVFVFVEVPSIALIKTAVFNDENMNGNADAGETITYSFVVTNTGNVRLTNISIKDPLPGIVITGGLISLAPGESDSTTFKAVYAIKQSDINAGKVSNQAFVTGENPSGIIVTDTSDNTDNLGDNPTVLSIEGCVIKVFNAISANGDDKNERFYIQGIECYPENIVEIYNRWGVLVFQRENYNNEERAFRGLSEGRTTVTQSDGLPDGTYYYILKYKDRDSNAHQQAGYLYLTK